MKKLILLFVLCLFPVLTFGQQGTSVSKVQEITITIDSSTAGTVYYYFPGSGAGFSGWTQTAQNPKDKIFNTGDLTLIGKVALTSGTEKSDSLQIHFQPIGPDGYIMGLRTFYFDWTSNGVTTTAPTGAALVKDFSLFASSPTLGSSNYSFEMNMNASYPACSGFVFTINMNDGADSGLGDGIYAVTLMFLEVQ